VCEGLTITDQSGSLAMSPRAVEATLEDWGCAGLSSAELAGGPPKHGGGSALGGSWRVEKYYDFVLLNA